MLASSWQDLFDDLERFKEALRKNKAEPFRKETPDKRTFRIECVNRAQFYIQNYHIPAANSGRSTTLQNLLRLDTTMTAISDSGFNEWSGSG
jgi:hypothetical protein